MREGVQEISEGLIREDGKVLYPISDGIPLLVPEEGISLIDRSIPSPASKFSPYD